MKRYLREFNKLVGIFATLRSKNGCMWDREQTHKSLLKYLFAEAEEVREAISSKDMENLREELGDILLQVVFHAQIAKESKEFNIADVISTLNKKLIRRHPHIFGNYKVKNIKDVKTIWEDVKKKEKSINVEKTICEVKILDKKKLF
ncbi:MAG: MazG family protein [Endomicrobium sp.]|jgi:tetrapyrrole methylase family protein/MazG family protein|nr:MazG family protein [Endomicrobium sp.]